MSNNIRPLDNTAKAFSMEQKKYSNKFRIYAKLIDEVDAVILQEALEFTLKSYPSYKVKMKKGFFWYYFENNNNEIKVEEQKNSFNRRIKSIENNKYLFRVSYDKNIISLDIYHLLTDGKGALIFFKALICKYLNIKYKIGDEENSICENIKFVEDEYLKNFDKSFLDKSKKTKAYLIKNKSDFFINRTTHFTLDLDKLKNICKNKNITITQYLISIYIYSIYQTVYNKKSKRDIVLTVPIDLRKYYDVETFSNFFTCMYIDGNIVGNSDITLDYIIKQVTEEFREKLTDKKIESYLARDVKLGTNPALKLMPRIIKKISMKYLGKLVSNAPTSTFSNVGSLDLDEKYSKYVDNVFILVNSGALQRVKCTICSFENKLNITINSNLTSNFFEKYFYQKLLEYIGNCEVSGKNLD